ncbi:MAG: right-handed parallel beta-helix repeat-containing protein [Thermoflexales bacterium]
MTDPLSILVSFVYVVAVLGMAPAAPVAAAAPVEGAITLPLLPHAPLGGVLTVDRGDDASVTACTAAENDCTLRGAINKINAAGVGQEIQFAPEITQINLTAPLPLIATTNTSIIGGSGVPRINGAGIAAGAMLSIRTSGARISGLTMINGSPTSADIQVLGGRDHQIDGNHIGVLSPAATACVAGAATRESGYGVTLAAVVSATGGTSVWIHGNTIGCHAFSGIVGSADDAVIGKTPAGAADGNWIGTTPFAVGGAATGTVLSNLIGIWFLASSGNGANGNEIRNNVIANNDQYGILLTGTGTNNINSTSGNRIVSNTVVHNGLGSPVGGISLQDGAFVNTIGGDQEGDGNRIYANKGNGISITDSDFNGILGNTIGASDPTMAPNSGSGVYVRNGASNWIGGVLVLIFPFERGNIIAGNGQNGVWITGGAHGTTVSRNWIGNTPDGTPRPNQLNGVLIDNGAYSNTIGTGVLSQLNVIGGNNGDGVVIDGSATMSNAVRFNDIGVNSALSLLNGPSAPRSPGAPQAAVTLALPNDYGIVIRGDAHDNTVAASNWIAENRNAGVWLRSGAVKNKIGPLNLIFNNDADGIAISDPATTFNMVLTSTIYSNRGDGIREYAGATNNAWVATALYANGGLGIDQAAETSSGNIPTAGWPVITSVVRAGGFVTLTGTSDASVSGPGFANTTKVYVFSDGLDPSGHGEGQNYKGEAQTNSAGVWRITLSEGGAPRCYAAYKRTAGFLFSTYDYGSEFSPSTCVPRGYLPIVRR